MRRQAGIPVSQVHPKIQSDENKNSGAYPPQAADSIFAFFERSKHSDIAKQNAYGTRTKTFVTGEAKCIFQNKAGKNKKQELASAFSEKIPDAEIKVGKT